MVEEGACPISEEYLGSKVKPLSWHWYHLGRRYLYGAACESWLGRKLARCCLRGYVSYWEGVVFVAFTACGI